MIVIYEYRHAKIRLWFVKIILNLEGCTLIEDAGCVYEMYKHWSAYK